MRTEEIAERLNARRCGTYWMARCPAHDDKNPSLKISEGENGNTLAHCFAGCAFGEVVDSSRVYGIEPGDFYGKSLDGERPRVPPKQLERAKTIKVIADSDRERGVELTPDDIQAAKDADATLLKQYGATEDDLARAFAEKYTGQLQFDHDIGKWYWWTGCYWAIERTRLAAEWCREICRDMSKIHPGAHLHKYRTSANVEEFARQDRKFATTHERWDADPWLLNTRQFTIDLKTGRTWRNNPDDFITRSTLVSPKTIPIPIFEKFLKEITRNDTQLIRFIQQLFGYFLTGVTVEQIIIFIYGPGGNGKSVLLNVMMEILHTYAINANMATFTASKYERHPTELARLDGPRLVSAAETEHGHRWMESRLKELTGGDKISARFMRKDFFEFVPKFKLLFVGNHKPALHNVDEAARRRFHIVPFNFKPNVKDTGLPQKLREEYPGILQWALDGCKDWQQNGLIVPDIVRAETDEYFSDQDLFTQWLEECTEHSGATVGESSSVLFKSWKNFATQQGGDAGTPGGFKDAMIRAGFKYKDKLPGIRTRGYLGIAVKLDLANQYDR
ncbi:MAG: phage/plasmid primase, P4 family [Gammaproteobacteria bacterium]|nr:phage/plasmid primase, P4 family [Gammaproteobacteria bacterium]MDH5801515.1 phage/plasmid primase, P4 family [Gammaproteobacteria bacterium]